MTNWWKRNKQMLGLLAKFWIPMAIWAIWAIAKEYQR